MSDAREGAGPREGAVGRVESLVRAARIIADPTSELGRRARPLLVASTGLSPENVELALTECLETSPSADEIRALVASVSAAPGAHVILPANVFTAAHRAIALALASSSHVFVRPSRREPHFAALLAAAAPNLFVITPQIQTTPGDHVWAYGGDTSLEAIRASLPPEVRLHAQGPGYGVAVVDAAHVNTETAAALAADMIPFDQRGCLSPRAALVEGSSADAERFAELVAQALTNAAERIPRGRLEPDELADARSFRDAQAYAGRIVAAGPGTVALTAALGEPAPVGRNLIVMHSADALAALEARSAELTAIGVAFDDRAQRLERLFPTARISPLGMMQRPAFDGPVDRRRSVTLRGPARP